MTAESHAANLNTSDPQKETTRNPHGPQLTVPCENCHTAAAWRPIRAVPEFDHNKTKYPLRGMHEKVQCVLCHVKPVFTDVGKNCADCHADVHRRQMGPNCEQCHTVNGWNIAVQQVKEHFNRFPLLGAHAAVECDQCHKQAATGIFYGLSTQCDSCHLKDWQNTTNPPHQAASMTDPDFASANCQGCHNFDCWLGAKFDHSKTGFLLTNGHANLACQACHINNNYNLKVAPTDCGNSGCHLTTWQQTNNPPHPTAGPTFAAANCFNCHQSTVSWTIVTFNHATTGFPLTNGHANVPCASCHVNNNYNLQIAPTDCGNSGCHLTTWQQTNNPVHSTAGPTFAVANCSQCHDTISWTDVAAFNHATTGFALTGTHATTPCAQCHVNNNYTLSSADCMGCHLSSWQSTQTLGGNVPNHVAANFPTSASACATCHPITTWSAGTFDHSSTGFPLTNSHQMSPAGKVTACTQCHIGGNYALSIQPTDCGNSGCHLTTYNTTNNPSHAAAATQFPIASCSTCHDTISWTDTASFNHASTGFALTGAHATAACALCHVNNNYTLTSANTDCYGCHTANWNSTQTLGGTIPNHVTAGFPTSLCSQCHDTTTWADSTFNHNSTGFTLVGTHSTTACALCHTNNNYNLTSANTDCYGCHASAYTSTASIGGNVPNHVAANFPTSASACSTCHPITTWAAGVFDHSSTGFPLTNSHQMSPAGKVTACTQCHIGGNYALSIQPTDCGNSGCHLTTYNTTNNPAHATAASVFPIASCSTCHDTISWTDTGSFNHASTGFALTGAHATAACALCHVNNNYTLTSANTDCYGCHTANWNSTQTLGGTIPNHVTAGFPTSLCSQCHDTTTWADSTFNHNNTGFALTGTHATTACALCHTNNNYALTSANTDCYGCHSAAYTSTATLGGNVPNHVAANFPITATACAGCHPITTWAAGVFDHSTTGFALTGAHQMVPAAGGLITSCTQCHVNGNYGLTSANTLCYGCHLADWNSTQTLGGAVPNHVAAAFPTTCETCHTTTSWLGAVFTHTWFPIPHGGEPTNAPCNDCHQVSTDFTSFTCINCHTSTTAHRPGMSHPNVCSPSPSCWYGAETCYNCHKNGGG
jgi:hypothetical protein